MLDPQLAINCQGRLLSLERPVAMGILNLTPDSFFDGGRYTSLDAVLAHVGQLLEEGAAIIDVGGMSTRPGAAFVSESAELERVVPAIEAIHARFPEALLSIDTVRARVARESVAAGASIINDISAGRMDEGFYETVASLNVPYVLMHMQGTPETMQQEPVYENVVLEVLDFLIAEVGKLRALGLKDIVVDPGFGFGKTVTHNYQLLKNLHVLQCLDCPVLVGLSRKSMVNRALGIKAADALNGTTALHMVALQQGAKILRVHDVRPAVETIKLWEQLENA
ncbi:MAG: dihydropteroate synthase [Phaeodactylibacter sp.]|nr:dihydropteroate synthase [Phaeodactylibacter sp.]MCB9274340.1 dihydropteroate synthase [Lewinellaceae bacterium]